VLSSNGHQEKLTAAELNSMNLLQKEFAKAAGGHISPIINGKQTNLIT